MELQGIERLHHFKRGVVMPVFKLIQQDFVSSGYRVQIAERLVTGNGPLDELLIGLVRKFSVTFLADTNVVFGERSRRRILAAMMVQLPPGVLVTKHLYEDRLCLGVESKVGEDGAFPTIVSVFGASREGQFKLFHHGFDRQGQGCDIARLGPAVLMQRILDILAAFEVQGLSSPR
jgi:hypothetical protein